MSWEHTQLEKEILECLKKHGIKIVDKYIRSDKEECNNDNCLYMADDMNHHFEILFSTDYVSAVQYHVFDLNISATVVPGDVKRNIEFNIIVEGADANHFQRWFRDVIRYSSEASPRLNYKVDAILLQYDSNDKIYKRFKVYNAYPISISPGFCVDSIDYTFKFTAENIIPWGLDEDRIEISAEDIYNNLYIKNENPIISEDIISPDPITWDDYFMNVAILTSLRSKDKNTKVGATLVDSNNRIIGCGYNGLPSHLDESKFPTSRDSSLPYNATKYAYTIHAEMNALLNCTVYDLKNSKLYVTLFPCCDCVKMILQKGISEIVYLSDKYHDEPHYIASRKLLDEAGVNYRQYTGKLLVNNI